MQKSIALFASVLSLGALSGLSMIQSGVAAQGLARYSVLVGLTGIALFLSAAFSVWSLWPAQYNRPPKPSALVGYREYTESALLLQLIATLSRAYESELPDLARGMLRVRLSLGSLMIGLVLFLVLILARGAHALGS